MKTIPFNEADAKAGREVLYEQNPVRLVSTDGMHAWCQFGVDYYRTIHFSTLSHNAEPAPGHNPLGLDEWQVGTHDGQRTLVQEEIRPKQYTEDIEVWSRNAGCWVKGCTAETPEYTYRTRKPPGYFLPRPKTRLVRKDELPNEFVVLNADGSKLVVWIWNDEWAEEYHKAGRKWSRSFDGPWRPFTVEEK